MINKGGHFIFIEKIGNVFLNHTVIVREHIYFFS